MGEEIRSGNRSPESGDTKTRMAEPQPSEQSGFHSFIYSLNRYLLNIHFVQIWFLIGSHGEQYGHCLRKRGVSRQPELEL